MSEETTTPVEHDFTWLIATEFRKVKNQDDPQWQAAFAEYNEDHKNPWPPVKTHMRCGVCYAKVLIYLRRKHGR